MRTKKREAPGFTLIEIMIVVALIGLLATIATPTWVHARTTSQKNACINNLRQIEAAKQQWALDTRQGASVTPNYTDISGYLKNAVSCPAAGSDTTFSGSYTINALSTNAVCNILPITHYLAPEPTN